jgi:hypothetical protein
MSLHALRESGNHAAAIRLRTWANEQFEELGETLTLEVA